MDNPSKNRCKNDYQGLSINDVTVIEGRIQRFCDDSTNALVIKSGKRGGGAKIGQNCLTSFMDDPLTKNIIFSDEEQAVSRSCDVTHPIGHALCLGRL